MEEATRASLVRDIRRWDLVALIINGVIGAGIFGLPSKVFALTGTYSVLALIGCAIPVGLILLCFAEVSSRFTDTGGPYLYARRALGPVAGYAVGWVLWVSRVTAFATVCNLLVTYAAYFCPAADSPLWRPAVITSIVVALTVVNLVGVRKAAVASNLFAIGKLIPIVLFVVIGLFFVDARRFSFDEPPSYGSFVTAMMVLIFAFSGFEVSTISAGEVQNPRRNYPVAMAIAISFVVVLYVLIQVVCIGTLPDLSASQRPLVDAAEGFAGTAAAAVIGVGALISMTGTLNSALLGCTRLPYALAEQGQAPSAFLATHRRFRTPWFSIALSSVVTLIVTLSNTFMSALTISTIAKLLVYVAVCAAVPVMRRRGREQPAGYSIPGGTLVSVVAVALCVWLMLSTSWREVRDVALVSSIGLGLYVVYRLKSGEDAAGKGSHAE
jgi:amino acid transporter